MKKYILMLAVAAATALVACGNKEAETTEPTADTTEVAEEEIIVVTGDDSLVNAGEDTAAVAGDSIQTPEA